MLSTRAKLLIGSVLAIAVLFCAGVVAFVSFVQPVRVEGRAMEPALHNGDRVLFSRIVSKIERGDIVLFRYPFDLTKSYFKRVVGLPGETVEIREGATFINGAELKEPYINPQMNQARISRPPVSLKTGQYFVMGDNRDQSNDSRAWGALPRELIYGKLIGRY